MRCGAKESEMAIERAQGGSSLVEVIDRILDKGIVIDAWVRVSLVGIELVTVEARVVIASVDTYLRYADAVSNTPQVARPKGVEARPLRGTGVRAGWPARATRATGQAVPAQGGGARAQARGPGLLVRPA
jgi:gas vesicle structural protein